MAAQRHVGIGRGRNLAGVTLDRAGARRATEGRSATIVADEKKCLGGIVRVRTWLAHELSGYCYPAIGGGTLVRVTLDRRPQARSAIQIRKGMLIGLCLLLMIACGPRAHIPPRPLNLPGALPPSDSMAILARRLAPVLYQQRDEQFPLSRVVAFLHPERRVIAYHLLWRDDVHGSWLPFTVPTDEEIIWVGYDSTGAPTEVWTYWHSRILHSTWPKSQVVVNIQWGKHGSFPRGMRESDLPRFATLNFFYAMTILGIPDMALGNTARKGPWCFCHSYRRYRDYSKPLFITERIDVVAREKNPRPILTAVFGKNYSNKDWWPWSPPY
ncbi:MAG: hypothetical protein H7Z74_18455 [Anaerolineae bacterium]|nr:hypothetical protein [Gemmatimonadaceae bacterium]